MAASFCQQCIALLWKCFLIRRRAMCSLVFELVLPIISAIILALMVGLIPNGSGRHEMHVRRNPTIQPKWEAAKVIYYAPRNHFTKMMEVQLYKTFAATIQKIEGTDNHLSVIGYSTENEMIRAFNNDSKYSKYYDLKAQTCIVYEGTTDQTNIKTMSKLKYKLRSPADIVPDPNQLFPTKVKNGPSSWDQYTTSTFIIVQILLNEAFLDKLSEDKGISRVRTHHIKTENYPYPSHHRSKSDWPIIRIVSFFVVFGFIVTFPKIVSNVTKEKINKSRELFRMMGLTDWVYWLTTILMYFIILVIQVIVITILFMIKFNGEFAVINAVNPFFIFIIFTIFGLNMILYALLISIPFSRPVLGTVCSLILWVVTFFVPMIFLDPTFNEAINIADTNAARIICCLLLPNFALSVAMLLVGQYDVYGNYATWSTLFEPIGTFGKMTLGFVFVLMIISSLLLSILIWYMDNVWPWQDGVAKPIWFPFTKIYWFPRKSSDKSTFDGSSEFVENPDYFENFSMEQKRAIVVRRLRKKFGRKYAVDGVNLDIVHGITCLLGHNGAGKTTMMSMITGIISADGGKVSVSGYDVATQTRDARASMSLCPQHNVLYEELTVIEHLRLYAAIKGIQWKWTQSAAIRAARAFQLELVMSKFPRQLSGGMKRKLCLSIALVGNTSVVILDEPTSGLDPEARRAIWDLLREVRRERTILLTTHFMEEADALGDRIAIMSAGRISCYGTPIFLKKAFSAGYQLRVAKQVTGNEFNRPVLMSIVQRHFPKGVIKSDIDNEVIISLESDVGQTDSSCLPAFLKDIEDEKNEIGIDAFGLSFTTLEDVFLKVGELSEGHETLKRSLNINSDYYNGDSTEERLNRVTGMQLNFLRLKGLLFKRLNYARRAWPSIILHMFLPCLLIGFCFWATNARFLPSSSTSGVLEIQKLYGSTYGFYRSDDNKFTQSYKMAADESSLILKEFPSNDYYYHISEVAESTSLSDYITKHLISVVVQRAGSVQPNNRTYTIWYNTEALHALPVALNLLYEALFRELSGNKLTQIELISQPILSEDEGTSEVPSVFIMKLIWLTLISLSIPFLGASYAIFPTHERASKAKLLQLMTGINPCLFWFGSFLFDMSLHLITTAVIMITFAIMDAYGIIMVNPSLGFAIFILFVVYGLVTIILAYVFSNLFAKPSTVFLVLVVLYAITSIIMTCLAHILSLSVGLIMEQSTYDDIIWSFRVSPVFSMAWATSKVYLNGLQSVICEQISNKTLQDECKNPNPNVDVLPCCVDKCSYDYRGQNVCAKIKNPFSWSDDGINKEIFMMMMFSLIAFVLLCVLEINFIRIYYKIRRKHCSPRSNEQLLTENTPRNPHSRYARDNAFVAVENTDVDVEAERLRVESLFRGDIESNKEALIIKQLMKRFGNVIAVDGLTFGVHNKECFGLLGVNGAGKTTTFRMLTGDLRATSGDAISGAFSVNESLSEFQQQLGYCPQFDALLNKLSGREMLFLFGRLRGIPENILKRSADELITTCDLSVHIDKKTQFYSGGNKRKLSLALALIGSPNILLLDEPTSGVDPGSRRHIWSTLATVRHKFGCSIILSSHSMDECEALCSRLGIMVNGQLKCLGSVQHIKDRFGQGYTVIIKLKEITAETKERVAEEFELAFEKCTLRDSHELLLNYHITDTKLTWSHIFETMENLKSKYELEDYVVSDTTLDQIFIVFARGQQNAKKIK